MSLNTTQIGNEFEEKVTEVFKNFLRDGSLGVDPLYAKVFTKPKYYSRDREADITFDLSIEIWPKGAERCAFMFLIECKKYSHNVPVNDVEEFYAKIGQVTGTAVKGVLVTNKGFQQSAFQIAKTKGMMLVLYNPTSEADVLLHKRMLDQTRIMYGGDNSLNSEVDSLVRKVEDGILKAFLDSEFKLDKLTKEGIRLIAEAELNKINPNILGSVPPRALSFQRLEKYVQESLGAKLLWLPSDAQQLGGYDCAQNIFYLNPKLKSTNRHLFVLAHEVGHYVLHRNLRIDQVSYDSFSDPEYNFRTNKYELNNPKHWIEWQANCFASALVVPAVPLVVRLYIYQEELGTRRGKLYVDDQYVNVQTYRELIKKLAYFFDVSRTTVVYKLKDMDCIINGSRLKRLNEIMEDLTAELYG
jgi:Zn-dependent peptidase ImmA (M78 family)